LRVTSRGLGDVYKRQLTDEQKQKALNHSLIKEFGAN
jgi:hypothetical protein